MRLLGAAYGSAGERCMAISVAVAVGEGTADTAGCRRSPQRVKNLAIDQSQNGEADMGPLITAAHRARVVDYIAAGVAEGARSSSTAADTRSRATRVDSSSAAACSTASRRR